MAAIALVLGGWGGCSEESAGDVPATLARLREGKAVYGFAYTAPPPEGQRLVVSVHDAQTANPCELYSAGASGEFWYLRLEGNDARAASYLIAPNADSVGSASLKLSLVRRGEKVHVFRAMKGEVSSKVDLTGHGAAEVSLHAEFPTHQANAGECSSTGTAGGVVNSSCLCKFEDGTQTTCKPLADEDCCLAAASGELEPLDGHWAAEFCPEMCSFTSPELAQYCYSNARP